MKKYKLISEAIDIGYLVMFGYVAMLGYLDTLVYLAILMYIKKNLIESWW